MKPLMAAWMIGLLLSSVAVFAEQNSMVFVPAGEFTMGVSDLDKSNALAFGWGEGWSERITFLVESAAPQRSVHVGDFFLDRYEVTNQGYFAYVVETSHRLPGMWRSHTHLSQPDQPVVGVSWADAQSYCQWANKRLPTEAEWEKAARGIDARSFPWGNDWNRTRLHTADALAGEDLPSFMRWNAWREDTRADETLRRAAPVGTHPEGASPYGAEDMAGNVWEWVDDWFDAEETRKVLRGGGFDVPRMVASTWFRESFLPPETDSSSVTGFRCARSGSGQMARVSLSRHRSPDSRIFRATED